MAESRRRSSILKKQDTCIIEGTDGNTRVARTPRRVSFAQTLTLREFECHEFNGSNNDESSSREDANSGEVLQRCSASTSQRGFEISPNTSLTEEFLAASPENQPRMMVEALNTLIHDSENIATDRAMAAFVNENRLNQTVVFSNMDDSACGMDITANISQLPEGSFALAAEGDGLSASQMDGRQQSKPGFHRRPSFSNDFCDGVFIKRYPKLLDDLFKLGKSGQASSNQGAVVKEKPQTEVKLYDDCEDMEMTGVFSEDSKRKALNDITRRGMLTPIEEMSVLSRNVSLADPDLVAGNKFYGTLVPSHLHQVYMKLDRLKNELETECLIDKENIPVIPFPGQSFKESVVDTSCRSGVHSGDPSRKDMAELDEGIKQAGYKLFQNKSNIRETLGSNSDMELTSSCTKTILMGPSQPHPATGAFSMKSEPIEAGAVENLEGKTLYMEDGGDMELTTICTRTIHLEPDLPPLKDHLQNTWALLQMGKPSNDKTDQSDGQTVYMVDGGDMELTSVFTKTIHVGPSLRDDPLNKNNSLGWQERDMLNSQTLYMADGEDMEFTNVCTKTIHMGHNLTDNSQSQNISSIGLQENKLAGEKMLNSQTVYMKDGEDIELISVSTKSIHLGPNVPHLIDNFSSHKSIATDQLKGQTVYMTDGEDMSLTSFCTKTIQVGHSLMDNSQSQNISSIGLQENKLAGEKMLNSQTVYMKDGEDMEFTNVCTKSIHVGHNLTDNSQSQNISSIGLQENKLAGEKMLNSQTVYMKDGEDMEFTNVCTKSIHVGHNLTDNSQSQNISSIGLQENKLAGEKMLNSQTVYMKDGEDMEFTNVCTKSIHVGHNLTDNSQSQNISSIGLQENKLAGEKMLNSQTVYMKDGEDMEFTNVCTKTIHVGHNLTDNSQSQNISSIGLQENKLAGEKMLNSPTVYMKDGEDMEFTNVCTKNIHVGHNLTDNSRSQNISSIGLQENKLAGEKMLKSQTVYMKDGEDMEFTNVCTKTIHMRHDLTDNSQGKNNSNCLQERELTDEKMLNSQTVYMGYGGDMEITSMCTKTIHMGHSLQPIARDIKSTDAIVSKDVKVLEGNKSTSKESQKHQEPIMEFYQSQHLAGPQVTQNPSSSAGQYINSPHADSFVPRWQMASGPAMSQKNPVTVGNDRDGKKNSVTLGNDRDGTKNSGKAAEYCFKRSSQESPSDDPACKKPKKEVGVTPNGKAALDQSLTFPKQMASVPSTYQSQHDREASISVQFNSVPTADCDPKPNHETSRPAAETCPEKYSQDQQKATLRQDLTRSLLKDLQFPLMLTRSSASGSSAPLQKRKSCNFNLLLQPRIPTQPSCSERLYKTANPSGCNPQVENEAMSLGGEMLSENNSMTTKLDITGKSHNSLICPPYPVSHSVSSLTGSSMVSFSQHESPEKCLKKSGSSVLALSPLPDIWDPFEVPDKGQLDLSQCDSLEMINNQTMPELAEDADSETELSKTRGENLSSKMVEQGHQTTVPKPVTFSDLMEELGLEFGGDVRIKQASVKPIPLSTVEEKLMAKLVHVPKTKTLEHFIEELTLTVSRSKQACETMLYAFSHQLPATLQAVIQAKRDGVDPASLKLKAQETANACRISARAKWKRHKADHLQKYTSAREAAQEGLSREVGEVLKDTEKLMDLMGDIDQCLQEVDVLTSQQKVLEAEENKLGEIERETAQLKIQCEDITNKVTSLQEDNQEALKRIAGAKKEVEDVENRITWMQSLTEWSLLENTEKQMDFGFLFGTIALQVKLTSPREEILEVSLKSRIGEQSRPWAKFVHNLAMSSIDCDLLMGSYKDYSQLRLLLNDVSLVSLSCRQLVDELKLVHLQHQLMLTDNRVTIVMKNREVLCKLQLDTEIKPNTYPDTPLHWTIVPLIGTVCLEDVKSAVNHVPGGYKYIERTLAAVSQCLSERK